MSHDPTEAATRLTEDLAALDPGQEAIVLRNTKGRHVGSILVDDIRALIPLVARVAELEGERDELRTENDGLFFSYSSEKSRREIVSEAFEEVRAERDKLAEKVRELEFERELRCRAMGPPSLCGDDRKPLGPCELPPGHRNAYHRDGRGWWLDAADSVDDLPGLWALSDLSGGETDAAEIRRSGQ